MFRCLNKFPIPGEPRHLIKRVWLRAISAGMRCLRRRRNGFYIFWGRMINICLMNAFPEIQASNARSAPRAKMTACVCWTTCWLKKGALPSGGSNICVYELLASDSVDMNRTRVGYHVRSLAHTYQKVAYRCAACRKCHPNFHARLQTSRHVCRSFEHEVRILSKHANTKPTPSRRPQRSALQIKGHAVIIFVHININMPRAHMRKRKSTPMGFFSAPWKKAGELNACTYHAIILWRASMPVSYAEFFPPLPACIWC